MKKLCMYIIFISLLCFIIPLIFVQEFKSKEVIAEEKEEQSSIIQYNYRGYETIGLLHAKTGEIEKINLDEYLYGVVSAEMPADFEMEALKAQAIVARTYTMYKIINGNKKHGDADICDDSACCQAWISKEDRLAKWEEDEREYKWNKIVEAVNATAGRIITYNNEPINAFFHANSGGKTETPINVWGGNNYPYLQAVETSGEENYNQYASEVELTKQELIDKIKETHSNIKIDYNKADEIKIIDYTEGGRIKSIKFGNVSLSGVEARKIFGLKSANFSIEIDGDKIRFKVLGYGHGVGMSQTGSDSLAKQGKNCEEIIKHFYQGVEIVNY